MSADQPGDDIQSPGSLQVHSLTARFDLLFLLHTNGGYDEVRTLGATDHRSGSRAQICGPDFDAPLNRYCTALKLLRVHSGSRDMSVFTAMEENQATISMTRAKRGKNKPKRLTSLLHKIES
jgi:hypothetical protein